MTGLSSSIAFTYGLLALAVVALWLPPVRISEHFKILTWSIVLMLACAVGVITGSVSLGGIASLTVFFVLAYSAKHVPSKIFRLVLIVVVGIMTLALSMHKIPGFANPAVASDMLLGHGAPPFTHHLNFDTSAAGIILFAIFCVPARTRGDWINVRAQFSVIFGVPAVVLTLGVALKYVSFNPKLVAYTPIFLVCNLLFTCVTEEAFFQGFMQHQLALGFREWRHGGYVAMTIAAVLFGIAHARGGPVLICLAALAGLGYGYAYLSSKRIEASILTHFTLNAVHFMAVPIPSSPNPIWRCCGNFLLTNLSHRLLFWAFRDK